jgi:predicted Zn-dependent peptidase
MNFHHRQFPNGLNVIAELNPNVHSAAVGFFVRTGSRDETAPVSGVSHFLEHMAFKGNDRLSADDVNRVFDEIGANYNASTSEEVTMFYAAVLPEYLPQATEILTAILFPSLRQDDFDMEKQVILEEIGMYEDQPSFVAYENLMRTHFAGHPLSMAILGSNESITNLTSEQMRQYHREHYGAGTITMAVAGNSSWDDVQRLAEQYCGAWPTVKPPRPTDEARPAGGTKFIVRESAKQQHVMQMAAGPVATNPLRHAAELLTLVIGDDSGSRLYWQLVDPGHADTAEVGYNEYDGTGTYLTALSCRPEDTAANLARIAEIYADVNRNGVTETELAAAKSKALSKIVLRSERPLGRLSSLGSNWVYRGEYQSVEEELAALRAVTTADIRTLLEAYPLGQTTTVGVGALRGVNGEA